MPTKLGPSRRKGDDVQIDGAYQHRALHEGNAVQRFWHRSKRLVVDAFLPPEDGDYVMDVGCGAGTVSGYLGESGAIVVGLDGNTEAVEFATGQYGAPNVTFQEALVDDAFEAPRPVDKIYSMEVIEHIYLDQGEAMLANFARILRPGGRVLLTTPNYRSLWPLIEWTMDRLRLAPPLAAAQHVEHYRRAKLLAVARRAGLTVELCRSSCFLSPWIAPVSSTAARTLHGWELRSPVLVGSILACVFRKGERS
jgi:2-polyprenyl-3-methyl-5-hydroxy-6-metoxy-1,4-benzoquinol methylase